MHIKSSAHISLAYRLSTEKQRQLIEHPENEPANELDDSCE